MDTLILSIDAVDPVAAVFAAYLAGMLTLSLAAFTAIWIGSRA